MTLKEQLVREIHAPARKNFPRSRVIIKGIGDLWQADLIDMIKFKDRGFRYILTIIDCGSKVLRAVPLKRKTGTEVATAMGRILIKDRPRLLQTDDGKEFFNRHFAELMKKFNINHYSTFSPLKASIIERANRTLKERMWFHFNLIGSYKWVDHIERLVREYNNSFHSSIGMKPIDVKKKHESLIVSRLAESRSVGKKPKLRLGEWVRISKYKHLFEKGYIGNWTFEQFKIDRVLNRGVPMYSLSDSNGEPIAGLFYEQELKATRLPGMYLVEKIIRRRGDRALVKWLGFPPSHNSWVPSRELAESVGKKSL